MSPIWKRNEEPAAPPATTDELVKRTPVSLKNTQEAALRAMVEAEQHICPRLGAALALLEKLVGLVKGQGERIERLEACVRVQAGQLERWELHQVGLDPHYPLRQDRVSDLEARRTELQRRLDASVPPANPAPGPTFGSRNGADHAH